MGNLWKRLLVQLEIDVTSSGSGLYSTVNRGIKYSLPRLDSLVGP
jgi:hypothetical protein